MATLNTYPDNISVEEAIQTRMVADLTAINNEVAAVTAGSGVLVSSDDSTVGYLDGKLLAGEGIDLTVGSPAGNETLTISCDRIFNKNAIINGDFNIWQRGTSFSSIASNSYSADRWRYVEVSDSVHTVSRDTDVPTQSESEHQSNYSLKLDCTTIDASIAAGDQIFLDHKIEGYNFAPFVGRATTLSFWVKSVKTGIYCVAFVNSGSDRSYVVEYTINSASTWEKKTITLTFDYSGGTWNYIDGIGIRVVFAIATGSTYQTTANAWQSGNYIATSNQVNGADSADNNFWLAQVQFELGSVATDFEYRQFGDELARCQRYYWKTFPYATAPAQNLDSLNGAIGVYVSVAGANGYANKRIQFPVVMRGAPTIIFYSTHEATANWYNNNDGADTTAGLVMDGANDHGFTAGCAQGATDGQGEQLFIQATASVEL
uniref:Uncharacterized protein n=1 Tax=viral metagenome TaxID=1070528 RepID=A0A6M3XJX2_9ZZZZ